MVFSGPNRARNGSGDQRIVIELLDEGIAADTFDVDLGRSRRRISGDPGGGGQPPNGLAWKILAGVAIAAVLTGAVVWLQRGDGTDTDADPAPTTLPSSTTRGPASFEEAPPSTAPPSPTVVTVLPTTFLINGGQPIIDLGDPGSGDLGVFLVDENNRDEVYRLDLRRGIVSLWENGDSGGDILAMLNTTQGPKALPSSPTGGWTEVWPKRDGTYWKRVDDGAVRLIDGATGAVLNELSPPWSTDGVDWISLVGLSANDEPVVWGPDGRHYAIAADGTVALLSAEIALSLRHGNYTAVACLDDGTCQRELRTSVGTHVVSPPPPPDFSVIVSPDGRYAVETMYDGVGTESFFTDIATGSRIQLDLGDHVSGLEMTAGQLYQDPWTPDSRFFFSRRRSERFGEPVQLLVLEAATGNLIEVDLPAELGPLFPIAVM
jgi:hypothetical protein